MLRRAIDTEKLEHLLQAHWTEFLDHVAIRHAIKQHILDTQFKIIKQDEIPPRQAKITVTSFKIKLANDDSQEPFDGFDICFEYTMPKDNGVVIGSIVCWLDLHGELALQQSFGTHFEPKSS